MKLQVSIKGSKVHEVGYRVFLLNYAIELGCQRFSEQNTFERGSQLLVALIDGDEAQISEFKKFVESSKPEGAEISNITFKEYPGYVMSIENFMHFSMVEQLNKGIPVLLRMDQKQDSVLQKQDIRLQKQDIMIGKLEETKAEIVSEICATKEAIVSKLDQNREAIAAEIGEQRICLDDRLKRIEEIYPS